MDRFPGIRTEPQLLAFLDANRIAYVRYVHPPVFTCEEADRFRPDVPGVSTKTLFLRDRRGSQYLLMTACEKRVDLKQLGIQLGTAKLHFASADALRAALGVEPGSVTVLGLVNDRDRASGRPPIRLLVDSVCWPRPAYLCHPLVNTSTLSMARIDLEKFFSLTGHPVKLIDI